MPKEAEIKQLKEYAQKIMEGMIYFAILSSTTPEKQQALEKLQSYRLEIQDLLHIIVPELGEE